MSFGDAGVRRWVRMTHWLTRAVCHGLCDVECRWPAKPQAAEESIGHGGHVNRQVAMLVGTGAAVGLVVLGLWGWEGADAVVTRVGWEKRLIGAWAVRCAAVASMAAAQAVLIGLVVERAYRRRDRVCGTLKLSALFTFMVCAVSAIALGLAGR